MIPTLLLLNLHFGKKTFNSKNTQILYLKERKNNFPIFKKILKSEFIKHEGEQMM